MSQHQQFWNASRYAEVARFVSELGMPVVELLAPRPGERILDLGCGDGALTSQLAELGCSVVGVDSSRNMIAAAQELGLDARVMDATQLSFDHEFDAVFSNAALHWIPAAADVVAGVRQSLASGGRFVAEFGGAGNVATVMAAVNAQRRAAELPPSEPWYFPTATDYAAVLESQGFRVDSIELFPRPTPLPGHISDWIETFYRPFLGDIPDADWDGFVADVCDSLASSLRNDDGIWQVDYVRLRFAAFL